MNTSKTSHQLFTFFSLLLLQTVTFDATAIPARGPASTEAGFCPTCSLPQYGPLNEQQLDTSAYILQRANIFSREFDENNQPLEPRVEQERTGVFGKAYAPIGAVYSQNMVMSPVNGTMTKGGRSTGFTVSQCHMLTTYHSVFGMDKKPKDKVGANKYSAKFHVGPPIGNKPFSEVVDARPVFEDGKLVGGSYVPMSGEDWVLMKLDKCVGEKYGFMKIGSFGRDIGPTDRFEIAGYFGEFDNKDGTVKSLRRDSNCPIYEKDIGGFFWTECAHSPGGSGGPLHFRDSDGYLNVIGMAAFVEVPDPEIITEGSPTKLNSAIDLAQVLPRIKKYIEKDFRNHPADVNEAWVSVPSRTERRHGI